MEVGSVLDVPTAMLPHLAAHVVWIDGEEIKTLAGGVDLAPAIVTLTADNLSLQRRLLETYVQAYSPTHIHFLFDAFGKQVAILQHDSGFSRKQAEEDAAKLYHLTAWLSELRR